MSEASGRGARTVRRSEPTRTGEAPGAEQVR